MVTEALKPYWPDGPARALRLERRRHAHRRDAASGCDPATTLFIVASKTFTTQETMTNATSARDWFLERAGRRSRVAKHFVALSTNDERGREVRHRHRRTCSRSGTGSAAATRCGRRSACRSRSSSAWTTSRSCSPARHEMDEHFRTAPLEQNLPVDARRCSASGTTTSSTPRRHAILPYDQYLHRFAAYFQQGDMESNGKRVDRDGRAGRLPDRPDRLGRAGHQRPARVLPADPPGHAARSRAISSPPIETHNPLGDHHAHPARQLLRADRGADEAARPPTRSRAELAGAGLSPATSSKQLRAAQGVPRQPADEHASCSRSSTPRTLGTLIALYEHKIFTQGVDLEHQLASTSGASSWASSWPRRSCPSSSSAGRRDRPRRLDQRADRLVPQPHRLLTMARGAERLTGIFS